MNTKRSKNSNQIKNFSLAACAIMALGVMTAGEAAAQCRIGGNAGYGYRVTENSYNDGSHFNNRGNVRYNNGYGLMSGYRGYLTQRPSLSLGLSYKSNRNSRYDATYGNYGSGIRQSQLNHGNGFYNSSRQPAAYRHGNHIDVEDGYGRQHLRSCGF